MTKSSRPKVHVSPRALALSIGGLALAPLTALADGGWTDPDAVRAPTVCYAEGTSEAYMNAIEAALVAHYGPKGAKYNLENRWTGAQGTPVQLTWSLVPDGLSIPGQPFLEPTAPSTLFARMNQVFAGNQTLWISRLQSCFDRWEELSGIDFVRVTAPGVEWDSGASWGTAGNDTTVGDLRIAMHPIDGGNGILAYCQFPQNGDMVLDSGENWAQGGGTHLFLRNTVTHELGHGIGILHVCPANGSKLMEPALTTNFDGPRHDDVRAVQRHYGDPFESNDGPGTPTELGTLSGTPLVLGPVPSPAISNGSLLSLDNNGKTDWFRFHVDTAATLGVTAQPIGTTYNSAQQGTFGQCPTGTSVNSLAQADLTIEVRAADGTTVLTSQNATVAGASETISGFALPAAGDYFVRIAENNAPSQVQLYQLTIDADPAACTGSAVAGAAGCAGSGGCAPVLAITGCPAPGQSIALSLTQALGGQVANLLFGVGSGSATLGNGCVLALGTSIPISLVLPLGGAGNCTGSIAVPSTLPPGATPGTINLQAACSDPGKPLGFTLSNAVALTIGS